MNIVRYGIGTGLGAVVTFGLFMLMNMLILMDEKPLDDSGNTKIADIFMPEVEITAQRKEEKPEKPEDPEEPPPDLPEPVVDNFEVSADAVNMAVPVSADINISAGGGLGASDGEYLPIVKVAPIYPRRAASRGLEGYCIVEYVVTKNGSIRDPVVVDCPNKVFASASVKAALKFKYKPRVVDGEPIEVAGVQNKFTFTLEK